MWDFYQHKIRNVTCRKDLYGDSRGLTREELDDIVNYILMYPEEKPPEYREDFFSCQAVAEYRASLNINPEDTLVYGHTHDPFVNEDEANPGCWVSGSYLENSYLVIEDGRIDLNYWNDRKTEAMYIRHPGDGSSQAEMEAVV